MKGGSDDGVKFGREIDELFPHLRQLGVRDVLEVGLLPTCISSISTHVAANSRLVITGERRSHYLQKHPEIELVERNVLVTVLDPDEVHANVLDARMLALYRAFPDCPTIRVALWLTDAPNMGSSVHSARFAHTREQERGRRRGREPWRKG